MKNTMRLLIWAVCFVAIVAFFGWCATPVSAGSSLEIECADHNGDNMTTVSDAQIALAQAVGLTDCGRIRFAVIPDTQHAVEHQGPQLPAQLAWLAGEQLAAVAHVGDIVQDGDDPAQWAFASNAFAALDGIVPYSLAVGNHDQHPAADPSESSTDLYRAHFGPGRFAGNGSFASFFDGGDSHATLVAGGQLLIVSIEFGAAFDSDVLTWARAIISSHPDAIAIVVSHHITTPTGENLAPDGAAIFDALADLDNLKFVFGGHVHTGLLDPPSHGCIRNTGQFTDGVDDLWFITHNCQADSFDGSGWLRVYDLDTRSRTMSALTFSPHLNTASFLDGDVFTVTYD